MCFAKIKKRIETKGRAGGVYSRREFYFYDSNMHFSFLKIDIGATVEEEAKPKIENKKIINVN